MMKALRSKWWRLGAICTVLVLLCVWLGFSNKETGQGQNQEVVHTGQPDTEPQYLTIETKYGQLQFPYEHNEYFEHVESVQENIAIEVFYLKSEDESKEVFRLYFGDDQRGTIAGYLSTANGEITITYETCEYSEKDFESEEEQTLYYSIMDDFSVIMNSIPELRGYSPERYVRPVEIKEEKMRYWTVTLPENVSWNEALVDGVYSVEFSGKVGGQRIPLCVIRIGAEAEGDMLGFFMVENENKIISVDSFEVAYDESWSEEDNLSIYQMLDSVNDAIQQIMNSPQFSIPVEEVAQ